jgi:hypothetical protein
MSYRGDYTHSGDFLGIGKKLHEAVGAFGKGFHTFTAPLRIPAIRKLAAAVPGPLGFVTRASTSLAAGGRRHTAPIGSSSVGTPHGTHSAAIDTFLRGGGRFSAAGKRKLAAEHAIAAGVHPAIAAHIAGGHRRRIRWTNPKALARAERRIHLAVKHMTKYIRWVHPKKEGHAAPKFGKHKKKK